MARSAAAARNAGPLSLQREPSDTMDHDARTLPGGTVLEGDICIVGAGPAGMSLARQLLASGLRVVVLESGGLTRDDAIQQLNEGEVIGDRYAGLRETRHRRAGGTANIWNTPIGRGYGAKYAPLDPCDFEPCDDLKLRGWPFAHSHLVPFYRRAQHVCGLGPFAYDAASWTSRQREALRLAAPLSTRVYQLGAGHLFTHTYVRDFCRSSNVHLYHHVVVCCLETSHRHTKVIAAQAVSLSGGRLRVHADTFVLAAGAVENARLLLLSAGPDGQALGNRHGWVGRCLMEHPRDHALRLVPSSPTFFDEAAFYDAHTAADGTVVCGRIALDGRATRAARWPRASITLLPAPTEGAYPIDYAGRLLRRLRRLARLSEPPNGYGWSHRAMPAHGAGHFQLLTNIEQQPNPENRIVLSIKQDVLGLPRVEMHWRFSDEEYAALQRLRHSIASAIRTSGIGNVITDSSARPDPNAHHHAGTTRMHVDPRYGVVDSDLRVHETANLYVAGASVFPTAGFANPTLTIVALSLRLADYLPRTRLGG